MSEEQFIVAVYRRAIGLYRGDSARSTATISSHCSPINSATSRDSRRGALRRRLRDHPSTRHLRTTCTLRRNGIRPDSYPWCSAPSRAARAGGRPRRRPPARAADLWCGLLRRGSESRVHLCSPQRATAVVTSHRWRRIGQVAARWGGADGRTGRDHHGHRRATGQRLVRRDGHRLVAIVLMSRASCWA